MMKSFFFKVRVVSCVFLYADFGENTQKILARTDFTQKENLRMERVKPDCFIDKYITQVIDDIFLL